jgi:hypothetical protein
MTGVWILILALAAATAFGLWRRATDGRMKSTGDGRPVPRRARPDELRPGQHEGVVWKLGP